MSSDGRRFDAESESSTPPRPETPRSSNSPNDEHDGLRNSSHSSSTSSTHTLRTPSEQFNTPSPVPVATPSPDENETQNPNENKTPSPTPNYQINDTVARWLSPPDRVEPGPSRPSARRESRRPERRMRSRARSRRSVNRSRSRSPRSRSPLTPPRRRRFVRFADRTESEKSTPPRPDSFNPLKSMVSAEVSRQSSQASSSSALPLSSSSVSNETPSPDDREEASISCAPSTSTANPVSRIQRRPFTRREMRRPERRVNSRSRSRSPISRRSPYSSPDMSRFARQRSVRRVQYIVDTPQSPSPTLFLRQHFEQIELENEQLRAEAGQPREFLREPPQERILRDSNNSSTSEQSTSKDPSEDKDFGPSKGQ